MQTRVLSNITLNVGWTIVCVALHNWALQQQFEETFVALTLAYGCIAVIGNALFVSWQKAS